MAAKKPNAKDGRLKPSHAFGDIGEPITVADYQPITVQRDPEQSLALTFARLGRDYGGPLPADFVLHARRDG